MLTNPGKPLLWLTIVGIEVGASVPAVVQSVTL